MTTRIKPTEPVHVEHATNQKTGEEVEHMCVITLDRPIVDLGEEKGLALVNAVTKEVGGVDNFHRVTNHAFELMIAKTFPAKEVLEEVLKEIKIACSPIELPAGGGGKLITGDFNG